MVSSAAFGPYRTILPFRQPFDTPCGLLRANGVLILPFVGVGFYYLASDAAVREVLQNASSEQLATA